MTGHVLVCGGAGYIGSHVARYLSQRNCKVTVLDDLSTGHREAALWGKLAHVNVRDADALRCVFSSEKYDAVMHFCARSLVGESVVRPFEYYDNNVYGSLQLLRVMQEHGIKKIVFSSTAAVFGNPRSELIDENHLMAPINPYGASKLMVERMLADAARAYGLRSVTLRYFNAAGASPDGDIGEAHAPETHLIPNVLRAALGTGPELNVFGDDYATPDGTCIRDYVHVDDLAQAHMLALKYMDVHEGAHAFNLGNGSGFSVRQVISTAEQVTGNFIPWKVAARRPGDPAVLVASSAKARSELGWEPRYSELAPIIESAWRWHQNPRF